MSNSLPHMVFQHAQRLRDKTALRQKIQGSYRSISWDALAKNIRSFAKGLLSLGIKRGDRAAIMAPNGPEWVYADLGIMACGGLSVPIYNSEGIENILYILQNSESRYLFIQSHAVAEELLPHLDALPGLEKIILLAGAFSHPRILTLEEFLHQAETIAETSLNDRLEKCSENDVATIVYTSGTTGNPKGVMLTHANFLYNIKASLHDFSVGEKDECLSILPLSHVFERTAGYYCILHQGATIAYAESMDAIPANMREISPTIIISVPRMYEKIFARIMERTLSQGLLKKQTFFSGLKISKAFTGKKLAGQKTGYLLTVAHLIAQKTIFSRLKKHLGGRLRFFICGGAPLRLDVAEFFMAAGIPVYEGYGLTETSPVLTGNTPKSTRLGTVGRAVPGTEIRLAEDGEILAKGPGIFRGYWKDKETSKEAFTDGWFKTGDIGMIDKDGFLSITDRKKDIIITSGGENVAPQPLENLFKSIKYIANAMVYGDKKPYLTALLVPNFDNLKKYARAEKIDFISPRDLIRHPAIRELIRKQIDHAQEKLPAFKKIKKFTLLSRDFSREEGEVTQTLKIRRDVIARRLYNTLESMYLPESTKAAAKDSVSVEKPFPKNPH